MVFVQYRTDKVGYAYGQIAMPEQQKFQVNCRTCHRQTVWVTLPDGLHLKCGRCGREEPRKELLERAGLKT